VSGPPITLPFEIALTVGLAIHELTTIDAKYGALSVPNGTARRLVGDPVV
jgi:two-component sensor histidine kinase